MTYSGFYTLLQKDENQATVKLCDKKHPIFKAHFPHHPIMPGFMHFELVSALFGLEVTTIKKAKFSQIVAPNEILKYEKNNNKFRVTCHDKEVASFSL